MNAAATTSANTSPADDEDSLIFLSSKKQYGICQQIFCCRCLECMQATDQSLLTSADRKNTLKNLIARESASTWATSVTPIKDPLEIIIGLYLLDSTTATHRRFVHHLRQCRINPNYGTTARQREDIEYYIPQLCSYIAFHQEFRDESLVEFLKQAGSLSEYFAHLLYFYMRSLSQIVTKKSTIAFKSISTMMNELQSTFASIYLLPSTSSTLLHHRNSTNRNSSSNDSNNHPALTTSQQSPQSATPNKKEAAAHLEMIKQYGTSEEGEASSNLSKDSPPLPFTSIQLAQYSRIIMPLSDELVAAAAGGGEQAKAETISSEQSKRKPEAQMTAIAQATQQTNGSNPTNKVPAFQSTIDFFDDLMEVSEQLKYADPKIVALRTFLKRINEALPAAVYVPFLTNQTRRSFVLNIVHSECRVFSTKERSPFYICLELFNPSEEEFEDDILQQQQQQLTTNPDIITSSILQSSSTKSTTAHHQSLSSSAQSPNQLQSARRIIPDWRREYDISKPITVSDNFQSAINESIYVGEQRRSSTSDRLQKRKLSAFDDMRRLSADDHRINGEISSNYSSLITTNNSQRNLNTMINENYQTIQETPTNDGISGAYELPPTMNFDIQSPIHSSKQGLNLPFQINCYNSSPSLKESQEYQNNFENQQQSELDSSNKKSNNSKQKSNNNSITIIGNSAKNKQSILSLNGMTNSISPLANTLFGEEEAAQTSRIRKKSPYGHFKSWKLVHFIVKIFRDSGIGLRLRPYEIVSLGPDSGIIEVVKDSVTIDSLKRKLTEVHKQSSYSLRTFFESYYRDSLHEAQTNFCSSLAAYSLVCYFLQIKDRHNGNILLHRDGHLTHIDFGFLLSNAPGKGLAFESNVPFKLLSEYVDVLGGLDSEMFKTFRYLFFKGFQAARKHQDKILILVKMLYSSQGTSLPCFERGEEAINELEERFNPKKITIDSEMFVHTNQLINLSLDNWKSRWYDKWQYFCQGIFY